jgi:hypothetical protein
MQEEMQHKKLDQSTDWVQSFSASLYGSFGIFQIGHRQHVHLDLKGLDAGRKQ